MRQARAALGTHGAPAWRCGAGNGRSGALRRRARAHMHAPRVLACERFCASAGACVSRCGRSTGPRARPRRRCFLPLAALVFGLWSASSTATLWLPARRPGCAARGERVRACRALWTAATLHAVCSSACAPRTVEGAQRRQRAIWVTACIEVGILHSCAPQHLRQPRRATACTRTLCRHHTCSGWKGPSSAPQTRSRLPVCSHA
jgi:hypothetical protein